MTMKERVLQALADMPDDAAIEDFMERLYLLCKVERGVAQAEAGQTVTQEVARERMAKWLR